MEKGCFFSTQRGFADAAIRFKSKLAERIENLLHLNDFETK